MGSWRFLFAVIDHHLIPTLVGSCAIALALAVLSRLGVLRWPGYRALFILVALVKTGMLLAVGEHFSALTVDPDRPSSKIHLGIRLPSLIPYVTDSQVRSITFHRPVGSDLLGPVVAALFVLAGIGLCVRWLQLAPLYRRVYESRQVPPAEFPDLLAAFERLLAQAGPGMRLLPKPRLMVIRDAPYPAFAMGLWPPVIVISADLVATLSCREMQGILAHELAHVCRQDYAVRWLAGILRDVLIWNPWAWLWYSRLLAEQEKASDALAGRLLQDPGAVACGLVEIAALDAGRRAHSPGPVMASSARTGTAALSERLALLEVVASGRSPSKRLAPLCYACLVLFFLCQPRILLSFPSLLGSLLHVLR